MSTCIDHCLYFSPTIIVHLVKVKNITDASEAPNIMNARTLSVSEVELLLAKIFSDMTISKCELSIELTLNILLKCLDRYSIMVYNYYCY